MDAGVSILNELAWMATSCTGIRKSSRKSAKFASEQVFLPDMSQGFTQVCHSGSVPLNCFIQAPEKAGEQVTASGSMPVCTTSFCPAHPRSLSCFFYLRTRFFLFGVAIDVESFLFIDQCEEDA